MALTLCPNLVCWVANWELTSNFISKSTVNGIGAAAVRMYRLRFAFVFTTELEMERLLRLSSVH